jgi:PAS domain S-box-containing protein
MDRPILPVLSSHSTSNEAECFYKVINTLPTAIIILDNNNCIFFYNDAAKRMFFLKKDDVPDKQLSFIPQYQEDEFFGCINLLTKSGDNLTFTREFVLTGGSGNLFFASVTFSPLYFYENKSYTMLLIEDISHCGFAEDGRILKDTFAGKLLEAMLDGFSVFNTEGAHTAVNQSFCEMTGYSRKELIGTAPPHPYWPEEEYENIQKAFSKTLQGDFDDFELIFKRKNGERFPAIVSPSQISDPSGNIIAYFASIKDISAQKKNENELRLNEMRLESLLRISDYKAKDIQDLLDYALTEAVTLTQSKIGYIYFYDERKQEFTLNTWSREVMMQCKIAEPQTIYQLEKTGIWGETVRQRKPIVINDFSAPNPLKKGIPSGHASLFKFLTIPVFFNSEIVAVAGVANKNSDYGDSDVRQLKLMMDAVWKIVTNKKIETEQLQMQQQLSQARKMEAIGLLAGGIAHDFNNILGGITGFTDLLKINYSHIKEIDEITQHITGSAMKAADLIRQLLMFARKGNGSVTVTDINSSISNIVSILQRTIDKRIGIIFNFSQGPLNISVDVSQLESALLNLGINARDAMPEGGTISFSTQTITISTCNDLKLPFTIKIGTYHCIKITDTGTGIDSSILPRIFEPFFTTKEVGRGTGLGLASVYGFVKRHEGYINVESIVGSGSTFTLYLPAHTESAHSQSNYSQIAISKGNGTVLIVDDDEKLRESATRILQHLGYKTLSARNGMEAVECYKNHHDSIDLILLDIVMPVLNGPDCLKQLRELNPDVNVVITTGFGEEYTNSHECYNEANIPVLQKPYTIEKLSKIVSLNIQHSDSGIA